jgi:elongator complex protein 3
LLHTINREVLKDIIRHLVEAKPSTVRELHRAKMNAIKRLGLPVIPSNTDLYQALSEEDSPLLRELLRKKPVKTISGVSVITVVAPIYSCPHGKCIYCPGGVQQGTPQSYTGREPVIIEARKADYNPYRQILMRLEKLRRLGHKADKVEIIIIGGTFTATSKSFQRQFIKGCLDALNGVISPDLETALMNAENASTHVSGITVETKPDWAKYLRARELVDMGVTRVELGVQALDDDILMAINRGHTVADVVEATADLKDLAFKVCYHMMPNLPGSTPERDLEMLRRLFSSEEFRPDMLKIYPTLVLPDTDLEKMWRRGLYQPYSDKELIWVLSELFSDIPPYVRVNRILREIPLDYALDGCRVANLRQEVERRLSGRCRCIRCREVGRRPARMERLTVNHLKYRASGGEEWFITVDDEDADSLIGFLRLRIPGRYLRPELENSALVRELHVYGVMTPVGLEPDGKSAQHRGFGRTLLSEAERIAFEEYGLDRVAVISGVGVRNYYRKMGYERNGPYMCKKLK